jgi:hypothetical protein
MPAGGATHGAVAVGVCVGRAVGVIDGVGAIVPVPVAVGVAPRQLPNSRFRSWPLATATLCTPGAAGNVCVQPACGISKMVYAAGAGTPPQMPPEAVVVSSVTRLPKRSVISMLQPARPGSPDRARRCRSRR